MKGNQSESDRDWYLIYSDEEMGAMPYEVEYRVGPSKDGSEWHVFKHTFSLDDGRYKPEENSELIATVPAGEIRRYVKHEIGVEPPDERWREMGLSDEFLTLTAEEQVEKTREDQIIDAAILAIERGEGSPVAGEAIGLIMRRLGLGPGASQRNFDDRVRIFGWPESWPLEWNPEISVDRLPAGSVSDKRRKELLGGAEPSEEELAIWRPATLRSWSYTCNAGIADLLKYENDDGDSIILVEEWTGAPGTFLHRRHIFGLFPTVEAAEAAVLEAHPDAHVIHDWPRPALKS